MADAHAGGVGETSPHAGGTDRRRTEPNDLAAVPGIGGAVVADLLAVVAVYAGVAFGAGIAPVSYELAAGGSIHEVVRPVGGPVVVATAVAVCVAIAAVAGIRIGTRRATAPPVVLPVVAAIPVAVGTGTVSAVAAVLSVVLLGGIELLGGTVVVVVAALGAGTVAAGTCGVPLAVEAVR